MGARDFSPWEFIASAINRGRNPDGQWEAYDKGVTAGIHAAVTKRMLGVTPVAKIDIWYDRHTRNWIRQAKDIDGNQIGAAEYSYQKPKH